MTYCIQQQHDQCACVLCIRAGYARVGRSMSYCLYQLVRLVYVSIIVGSAAVGNPLSRGQNMCGQTYKGSCVDGV